MPILPVNNEGAALYYEDSGAPEGVTDYTTIIGLHGFLIHGGTQSYYTHSLRDQQLTITQLCFDPFSLMPRLNGFV
jgi:hypothetical protein